LTDFVYNAATVNLYVFPAQFGGVGNQEISRSLGGVLAYRHILCVSIMELVKWQVHFLGYFFLEGIGEG
jgi:hypothetical protein